MKVCLTKDVSDKTVRDILTAEATNSGLNKKDTREVVEEVMKEYKAEDKLGNDGTTINKTDSHELMEAKIWNDPKQLEALFDEMLEEEGTNVSDSHKKHLRELLHKITGSKNKILNEFKLYINRAAEKNGGMVQVAEENSEMILNIRDKSNAIKQGEMSAIEVYMHELVHMAVEVARTEKKGTLSKEIQELIDVHKKAAKYIKWEDLVVDGDEKSAKMLHNQMFRGEQSTAEFIALALTNEKVKSVLEGMDAVDKTHNVNNYGLFDTIVNTVVKIYYAIANKLTGTKDVDNMSEQVMWIADKMMEANSRLAKEAGLARKLSNLADGYVSKLDDGLKQVIVKSTGLVYNTLATIEDKLDDNNIIGQMAGVTKNTARLLNPWFGANMTDAQKAQLKKERTKAFTQVGNMMGRIGGILSPEGTAVSILNYLTDDDTLATRVEKMGLINKKIDGNREDTIVSIGTEIKEQLGNVSKKEQVALTHAYIETDVQSLLDKYSIEDIKEMMSDDTKLQAMIDEEYKLIDDMVIDERQRNYIKSQTIGLGNIMATGEGSSTVNRNIYDIVTMRGIDEYLELNENIDNVFNLTIRAVDRAATLQAIMKTDKSIRDSVANINTKGLETMLAVHKAAVQSAFALAKENPKAPYPVKGEIKDTSDSSIDVVLGKTDKATQKYMKLKGYKLQEEFDNATLLPDTGIYVSRVGGPAEYTKQAAAKINIAKRARHIGSVYSSDGKWSKGQVDTFNKAATASAKEEIDRQFDSVVTPKVDGLVMIPVGVEEHTYGVAIDKYALETAARQDNKAPKLLGKMVAEIQEKRDSIKLNDDLIRVVEEDMVKNYDRGEEDYIEIGPNSILKSENSRAYSDELYEALPQYLKDYINSKPKGQRYIAVRRDLASSYFGGRAPSLLNTKIPFTKISIDEALRKTETGAMVANIAAISGKIWTEIVSMEKVDIVIKTPKVLIDNVLSNIMYSSALSTWPWTVAAQQVDMLKETMKYISLKQELNRLMVKQKAKTNKYGDRDRIREIRRDMKSMFVHDMFEAGLFTTVMEDISDNDLLAATKAEELLEEVPLVKKGIEAVPTIIRSGLNIAYMNRGTKVYTMFAKSVQYSDFIARAQRLKYLTEEKGINKNIAMKMVTDELVNYNKLDSKTLRWANSMGFMWFTKYFFGANKSLIKKLQDKPTRVAAMMALLDLPNPGDASFIEKNYMNMFSSPDEVIWDNIGKNIVPMSFLEIFDASPV